MNVGQRIREAREDLGMPQTMLARRVGVARNTIGRYESGEHEPSFAMLEKIARELRTEPAEFLRDPVGEPVLTGPKADAPPPAGPPVVHLAKLSDEAYEELRGNARSLDERADLRDRINAEYEELRRWLRALTQDPAGAVSADVKEARYLLEKARKRYVVAVFDEAEHAIAFDEKRQPRLSRTAGRTVEEVYEEELRSKAEEAVVSTDDASAERVRS